MLNPFGISRIYPSRFVCVGIMAIGAAVLVTYHPSLSIGFFGDEWNYLRLASALPLDQYLNAYFNPQALAWYVYRPVQGIQFLLEFALFRGNATGYHAVHVMLHLANSLLLFSLVSQISRNWRVGLIAALIFGVLSTYGWSVLWTADAAPLENLFSMLALWLWWQFLRTDKRLKWFLAFVAFLLALFSRESSLVLPVSFFLMDYLLSRQQVQTIARLMRYAPFALTEFLFLWIEYGLMTRTAVGIYPAYALGTQIFSNLVDYMTLIVCPWGLSTPWNYLWLVLATVMFTGIVIWRRSTALLSLGLFAIVALLPFLPYRQTNPRYLYAPSMISAVLLSLVLVKTRQAMRASMLSNLFVPGAVALLCVSNSYVVADKALGLVDLAHSVRTPLRAVVQRHPDLPEDTYLYFINSPVPTPDLMGMFFMRYGPRVSVGGTDLSAPALLRSHKMTFVYYPNSEGGWSEQVVSPQSATIVDPALPVAFDDSIRLEHYELVDSTVLRESALILFLYWRSLKPIEKDYKVFVHWLDASGRMVDGYDHTPRDDKSPTGSWKPGQTIMDPVLLPITDSIPDGNYRLEIGLYDPITLDRVWILDEMGLYVSDRVMIGTIHIGN